MIPKFETDEDSPVNRDWKDYWRDQEKKDYWRDQEKADPSQKRNVREAKKLARRQLHKRNRKNVKEKLRNWNNDE